jgi:hypothetical protein
MARSESLFTAVPQQGDGSYSARQRRAIGPIAAQLVMAALLSQCVANATHVTVYRRRRTSVS